ncbi:hypothetical protein AVEN_108310-1 [Araneus ventricosus]|uniref:DDE-1 domain-containing protein n=1 Tax=Araneus ventricosus TaxID=182803 RepID=A0A4Y2SC75_ARAVE|nr:hypothetical protein AVEN_195299-1 [Araneus ventricosus]GBN93917.1 hypothetical protein AVEN_108310-1 [Araneus ventricosus]
MDQGIIRSFEVNYRRQLVRKLVDAIDEGSTLPKINVLDSMMMTDYVWRNVTQKIVQNCFEKAGFKNGCEEEKDINEEESESIEKEAEETVDAANEIGTFTDTEIVDNVRGVLEDEEAEEHTDAPKVTTKEAEKAVELLTTFLESQENVGHEGLAALANLRRLIETKKVRRQKSFAAILFLVKKSEYTLMKHVPLYGNGDLFSHFGGLIGCWLGISVWTFTDIMEKLFKKATRLRIKRRLRMKSTEIADI